MSDAFFQSPILNSPYEEPNRHWELDANGQPTSVIVSRRRQSALKAGKVHRVPLTDAAVALLSPLPQKSHFVFPANDPKKPLSNMAMTAVLKRMDMLQRCTVHGFRSSFRDWAGEATEYARELAEQALAHQVGNDVERAYRRGDALERRRELMAVWSGYLLSHG